jgi:hypothetical protein
LKLFWQHKILLYAGGINSKLSFDYVDELINILAQSMFVQSILDFSALKPSRCDAQQQVTGGNISVS